MYRLKVTSTEKQFIREWVNYLWFDVTYLLYCAGEQKELGELALFPGFSPAFVDKRLGRSLGRRV